MALTFINHRISAITDVVAGTGTYDIDNIPFLPNFIKLSFYGDKKFPGLNTMYWEMAQNVDGTYKVTVTYNLTAAKKIRHVIAALPVDPEHTIAFGK